MVVIDNSGGKLACIFFYFLALSFKAQKQESERENEREIKKGG